MPGKIQSWGQPLSGSVRFLISFITSSLFFECSRVTKIGWRVLKIVPTTGIDPFSRRLTPHGKSRAKMAKPSNADECGAKTKIFASSLVARLPLILMRWNPIKKHTPYPKYFNKFRNLKRQPFNGVLLTSSNESRNVVAFDINTIRLSITDRHITRTGNRIIPLTPILIDK